MTQSMNEQQSKHIENSNGNWTKNAFKKKNDERQGKDKKIVSGLNIKLLQKILTNYALAINPKITAGEFAKFHNESLRAIRG